MELPSQDDDIDRLIEYSAYGHVRSGWILERIGSPDDVPKKYERKKDAQVAIKMSPKFMFGDLQSLLDNPIRECMALRYITNKVTSAICQARERSEDASLLMEICKHVLTEDHEDSLIKNHVICFKDESIVYTCSRLSSGTLNNMLWSGRFGIENYETCVSIFRQLALGVYCFHKICEVAIRDISFENILYYSENDLCVHFDYGIMQRVPLNPKTGDQDYILSTKGKTKYYKYMTIDNFGYDKIHFV